MDKSQLIEIKEKLRVEIREKDSIINLKIVSEQFDLNYSNVRAFLGGKLSALSVEKLEAILKFINYTWAYFDNKPGE